MGKIERNLPNNAYQAAVNANAPGPVNTYATLADVLVGSGGNRIITGNAAYSGVGLIYDVTALTYIIQGTLYASAATQVTLDPADPTLGRIDVILVDDLNVVSVLTGVPSATPVKPQVDAASQVEVTFVSVPAGATAPVVVTETIYAEDLGTGGGEWAATTNGTVNLASTNDPYTGTVSIEVNGSFGPNKNILFTPGAPYTVVGGQLIFWLNAKSTMVPSYNAMQIGLFDGGVLQGNLVTVGGSASLTFGFDSSIVGTYQLVTIPLIAFGGVATTIDSIAFLKGGGATTLEFFLDDIDIQEGVPTPPAISYSLQDVTDVGNTTTNTIIPAKLETDIVQVTGGTGTDGTITWDPTEETIQAVLGNTILHIGQDVFYHVRNNSGSIIPKNTPVYASGTLGASGKITIAPMIADNSIASKFFIGVTAEEFGLNEEGKVAQFSRLDNLNTAALGVDGDVLWVSETVAGAYTTIEPEAPNLKLATAQILYSDATAGIIQVRATQGNDLGDDHLVHIPGPRTDGDVLTWIDANGRFELATPSGGGSSVDSSTGVLAGGELSVGTGGPGVATTYDISDGSGHIVTATGVKTPVSWTGLTGQIPIFGVSVITFVAINSGGTVTQQSTPFSRTQSRTLIPLGVIVHVNGINVDTINNEQEIAYNPMASLYDAMESIGFFNVSGNIFSANGANMTIDKSLGSLFKLGSNYDVAPLDNPHVRTNPPTVGGIFQYRFSDGSSGSLTNTLVDPNNLDDGAGGLTVIGTNRWSVQRVYIFTSNNIKIQRGVTSYSSSDAAISGLPTEPYITEPSLAANGLFRGWIIVKQGATVLNGVDAIFLSAGKFGESGGSVGSGTTTTLQAAYDNSSDSEIVVPSGAVNAFSLEAETDGAEIVQDWKDETSTTRASMTGDGNLTVLDINGVPITSAGATTSFLNAAGSYTVPAGGGGGTAKFNHTTYSYDYVGASGTWQGVAVAAVGNTEWNDRWRVASFAGTGGADGFYINFRLPLTYVAGTDLKVSLDFSSLTGGGGGTAAIRVGLCQPQVGGAFGTEATTAYAAQNLPVPVTDSISTFIAQFSGTTLNPGDQIAVQVFRDPGNGGDTSNATIYNSTISIDEV